MESMRVPLEARERTALVRGIFSRVVKRYDLLNHVLSLGRDVFWRRVAARKTGNDKTGRLLDLACGTGDQALALLEANPSARVTGLDFTHPMLVRASEKLKEKNLSGSIDLINGDALALPFPDCSFDAVTMAFGIRNIPDKEAALREMRRVLVPGGRAVILELAFPRWPLVENFYRVYLTRLIPKLGWLISGHALAYQYLADSILDHPDPRTFKNMMSEAGFAEAAYHKMTFGIAVIHFGKK